MLLKDLKLTENNCFIAMQYYRLILNRTYLVILTNNSLVGIVANGLVSAESPDMSANFLVRKLIIRGDLNNPFSYVKNEYLEKVNWFDLEDDEVLAQNRANFRIRYQDIRSVRYDPKRKWGMGNYPHDGKVYVETATGETMEFIILGNQSGELIKNRILGKKH